MLKKVLSFMTIAGAVVMFSCEIGDSANQEQISDATLAQIGKLGFSTQNVLRADGGYIVEGDIYLTSNDLTSTADSKILRIAEVEQYRTNNLVTGTPRTITVSSSGNVSSNVSSAIDAAIARYNAENLGLTFQRVSSGGTINIKVVNGGPYIASAGFPSGGNPYGEVKFNKQYQNWQNSTLASVFAHEMGHCIGFRHTDYMDRSFSCGGAYSNEGASSVGAVHIPGTPTTADAGSWMLACIGNGINRPFNSNDKTALNYLY